MTVSEYSQLLSKVIYHVGESELHKDVLATLKSIFKNDINSVRRVEKINSIGHLLKVLELRDLLSEDNVGSLRVIALQLHNNAQLLQKIAEYEKYHMPKEFATYASKASSKKASFDTSEVNINPLTGMLSDRKMQRIFETVTEQIGTHWRELGRHLKIRECDIDKIETTYESMSVKASKLMKIFEDKRDPQRWFFVLCQALEKCRRKELSREIQEIMVMNI